MPAAFRRLLAGGGGATLSASLKIKYQKIATVTAAAIIVRRLLVTLAPETATALFSRNAARKVPYLCRGHH